VTASLATIQRHLATIALDAEAARLRALGRSDREIAGELNLPGSRSAVPQRIRRHYAHAAAERAQRCLICRQAWVMATAARIRGMLNLPANPGHRRPRMVRGRIEGRLPMELC
jgi:hypothetical protein